MSQREPWEAADARLQHRAVERERQRERRCRRARRGRWLAAAALPSAGAVALTAVLEAAGGDLGGWPAARAVGALALLLLWPAATASLVWRRCGVPAAVAVGTGVFAAQVGLTFGVAFACFGYGPR